jgi:hypothetical protein
MIRLWFKVVPAMLAAAIAAGFLQQSFQANAGYRAFVAAFARAGWVILICATIVFVVDLAAMIVYTIRSGKTDARSGKVVAGGPLQMSLNPALMGRSKQKVLGSRSQFISMESLASGSATFGERLMMLGICIALASFFSIFLGVGLLLTQKLVILVLIPIVPGFVLCKAAHSAWTEYRQAKAEFPARHAANGPPAPSS